jgi:hypothetical protein
MTRVSAIKSRLAKVRMAAIRSAKREKARAARKGELTGVTIVRPAVRASNDVDLKAARKAAREYLRAHPKILEPI